MRRCIAASAALAIRRPACRACLVRLVLLGMRSLILMADALEVRPHSLLDDTPQSDASWVVTRVADQPEVANDGGTVRSITSNVNPRFNVFDFSGGPREFFTWYRATEDLLLIILGQTTRGRGRDGEAHSAAGDTLFVRGGGNHRWRHVGRGKCRVLTVLHAPQGTAPTDMLGVFGGEASPAPGGTGRRTRVRTPASHRQP